MDYLTDITAQLAKVKKLAEGAIAQVSDEELFRAIDPESNSIAVIMRHVAGNLRSRFTDFLTTDGEKPDRRRDGEFETPAGVTRESAMANWEEGWRILFESLKGLTEADMQKHVYIRGERHSVMQALNRAFGHLSYHTGQIVFLARHLRQSAWKTLSIPRGQSETFNGSRRW